MGFFRKNSNDSTNDIDDYEPTADGLPAGIEPAPSPRLPEIEWDEDVTKNAQLGIPQLGYPARALPFEEMTERLFNADMREHTKWLDRQRGLLPSLLEMASTRRAQLGHQCALLAAKIAAVEADISAQRDQLADPDRKFPQPAAKVSTGIAVVTTAGAVLETFALQPMIGQIVRLNNERAFGLAAFAVGSVGCAGWLLGGVLHRWAAYEGPRRLRRLQGSAALGLGLLSISALVAVVGVRILGRNEQLSTSAAVMTALLYAAMQGGVQLGAILHGWWHSNPRVRQLANTTAHLEDLTVDLRELEDARENADLWAESLADFQLGAWMTEHRAQLAEDYAAADFDYRNNLSQALIEAGHDDAVAMLHILPLPKFVPPVEIDPSDPLNWLTGGFLLPL
jgi:hypothetical protein